MPPHAPTPSEPILDRCRSLGFALAGVCRAEPSSYESHFRKWLADGKHAEMAYLERNLDLRLDPRELLPGARSLIILADQYATRNDPTPRDGSAPQRKLPPNAGDTFRGRIARYAQGDDYHTVIKKRLHTLCDALRAEHPDHHFRACVDTAPILEREHAARAGLGWIGKHTLLIHPRLGSYFFLAAIITTLDLEPPSAQSPITDHCGSCTRCIDACPTSAITPHSVDASRCISYLTIEHRSPINPALKPAIGDWLFGCDVCQEVCPHNSPRSAPEHDVDVGSRHPAYTPRTTSLPVLDVGQWTDDDRAAATRRSALKRANLEMFHRNATIVAQNFNASPTNS